MYRLQWLCTTEEHFWTLDSATLTWFRTLYPRTQRGHWRYFGTTSWTMTTWITAGDEGNIAGDAMEYATDWGKGLTVLLYRVFCSLMSNPWRIRWTIILLYFSNCVVHLLLEKVGLIFATVKRVVTQSCKNAVKLITSFECVLTELNYPPEAWYGVRCRNYYTQRR